ncbi:ATP synthase F1 subunit gamma [Candidatus Bipolaricaulota sp. J31]
MAKKTRQILRRIRNVRHVRQITHAMYTIASTQVIQRKRALMAARPFGEEARKTLATLLSVARARGISHPLFEVGEGEAVGALIISSDRGLCGRYNLEVNQAARRFAEEYPRAEFVAVGEKAVRFLHRRRLPVVREFVHAYERPNLDFAGVLLEELLSRFPAEWREVHVIYTRFLGELVQRVRVERLLPIEVEAEAPGELIVEPELPQVLNRAARLYLLGEIYRVLAEAKTSEHAMRRQAMKAATDNADELLDKLTLLYNKARQQGITREILDIMGGAEALREEE